MKVIANPSLVKLLMTLAIWAPEIYSEMGFLMAVFGHRSFSFYDGLARQNRLPSPKIALSKEREPRAPGAA